jgi:hypothetical protein
MPVAEALPNTRMEPTRPTVLCDPVTAARGSFATLGPNAGGHPSKARSSSTSGSRGGILWRQPQSVARPRTRTCSLEAILSDLQPGAIVLVIGGTGRQYPAVYAQLDDLAHHCGLKRKMAVNRSSTSGAHDARCPGEFTSSIDTGMVIRAETHSAQKSAIVVRRITLEVLS